MKASNDILKEYWGYDSFRGIQETIISSVMDGKSTLALMPTGGGKSICFQVPVLAKEGIGIVISPLIALMKDQVENLNKRGIKAVAIYAGMTYREIDVALDNCVYGDIKFLYVSPERTLTTLFRERLKKMNVSLIAIDEAHCISQWGHDFRPAYLKIPELKEIVSKPVPFLAVTATANKRVLADMIKQLDIEDPAVFKQSFARENLGYLVLHEENKEERLVTILKKANSCGIVYVNTRKRTVDIANYLRGKGINSDYYHGGLNQQDRSKKQEAWINNKTQIIVATNAFGMGIDKPDVRVVVHMDVPANPEAYFQEAGRAGRDGKRAYATLLYKASDKLELEKLHDLGFPDKDVIKKVYNALGNYYQLAIGSGEGESYVFDIGDFGNRFNIKPVTVYNSIKILELNNYLTLSDAIYHPTTLKVLVNVNDLYQYQVRNKTVDTVIRNILRTYPNIFESYKKIDLYTLSKESKISRSKLEDLLKKLQELELVDYIEAHDSPLLTYTNARVNEKTIRLSKESYREREKIKRHQLEVMVKYCETKFICRSRLLLAYFDEKNYKNCGICDTCIEGKKAALNNDDFKVISTKIKAILSTRKLTVKQLVNELTFSEDKTVKVIQFMLDNSLLQVKSGELELR